MPQFDTVWVNLSNQGGMDRVFKGLVGLRRGLPRKILEEQACQPFGLHFI